MRRNGMKQVTAAVLAAMLALTCVGCGSGASRMEGTETGEVSAYIPDENRVENADPSADNAGGDDGSVRKDLTALEVSRLMGNGINLGNTMEAYNRESLGIASPISAYEGAWGQPVTTQEMFTGMKKAGFDTVRIPVAWVQTMDWENGDYTIREDLLDRVEEIVGYARSEGMYVIINDHWDGGWWAMFSSADAQTRENAMTLYTSMWTQIAERFADYSDYVIFESANEELGYRLNDAYPEMQKLVPDSGTLTDNECFSEVNRINQAFVDTVRSTGGNNGDRFLLIAGFGTEIVNTCDSRFQMPTDTAESKLLVSVHYYDPSGYCIFDSIASWGNQDDLKDMNEGLAVMKKFTDAGYGVIIGEYGVVQATSEGGLKEGALEYTTNLLDNCNKYQFVPVLWDTNFLFNRHSCRISDDQMMRLFQKYSFAQEESAGLTQEELAAKADASMANAIENAEEGFSLAEDQAVAWIMFTSSDWSTQYSVGDVYDPTTCTAGIVSVDAPITGAGTYTVSLDFTGTGSGSANGVTFSALGIANGERLFPGYVIELKELKVNGEAVTLAGTPYTSSDDNVCTRCNLYNAWVSQVPDGVRTPEGSGTDLTPTPWDVSSAGAITSIEVTFDYIAP